MTKVANPHAPRGQALARGEPARISDDEKRAVMLAQRVCDGLTSLPPEGRRTVFLAIAQMFCTSCGGRPLTCACNQSSGAGNGQR